MGPVHHVVVVYSDSMSCLQAIEGEDTRNPFICHIMNLPWLLSDRGTLVRFCWIQSAVGSNQVEYSCAWQRSLHLVKQQWGTQWNSSNEPEVRRLWLPDFELAIPRPPSPIACLEDHRLTACHHCGQTLSIDHMLLECAVLQECRDENYIADSLNALFETIPETSIMGFLREAEFFYLNWMVRQYIQFITWITPDLMEFVNLI